MRSRFAAALTAAALLAAPTLVRTASADRLPPLPGALPLPAEDLGRAPTQTTQQVTLALALRDQEGLTRLLAEQQRAGSPDYHRWLTPQQFAARFAPSATAMTTARTWAEHAGLHVTQVSSNRTLLTLEGTRAQLERAFAVQLRRSALLGQEFVTPDRPAVLPVEVRKVSAAVLGLTTYNPMRVHHQTAGYQLYGLASYGPQDFAEIYNAPATTTGTSQSIAVITDGDLRQVTADLAAFEKRFKMRRVPLTVVQTTQPSTSRLNELEYALDTQYSLGFAPGIRRLYAYNGDVLGSIWPLNRFVVDRRALTASASYGGCESLNYLLGVIPAFEQVFRQAAAQGQTFWFSTGDNGSNCNMLLNTGAPVGTPEVHYPSSSPWVVAVGGTSLSGLKKQPQREIAWLGGGGGYSRVHVAAGWQKSAGAFVRAGGRGLPDISLDADPNSGYTIVYKGEVTYIGGTSASAPAWNGIWGRVLQRHPRIGFAAPALYRVGKGALVDITLGTNGIYSATPGYDLTTGLGTADIARLVALAR